MASLGKVQTATPRHAVLFGPTPFITSLTVAAAVCSWVCRSTWSPTLRTSAARCGGAPETVATGLEISSMAGPFRCVLAFPELAIVCASRPVLSAARGASACRWCLGRRRPTKKRMQPAGSRAWRIVPQRGRGFAATNWPDAKQRDPAVSCHRRVNLCVVVRTRKAEAGVRRWPSCSTGCRAAARRAVVLYHEQPRARRFCMHQAGSAAAA